MRGTKAGPLSICRRAALDGGNNWQTENFNGQQPGNRGLSADEHVDDNLRLSEVLDRCPPTIPPEPLNFAHPDFALMAARTGLARGVRSFFYVSYDRCRSWQGPYDMPMFGQTGIAARTDYQIQADHSALLFLTANKADGSEGKVICVRTIDGGQSFGFLAKVGEEMAGPGDFAIMPASLQLAGGRILCVRRCRQGSTGLSWIDIYASDDRRAILAVSQSTGELSRAGAQRQSTQPAPIARRSSALDLRQSRPTLYHRGPPKS